MKFLRNILLQLEEYKRLSSYVDRCYFPIGITGFSVIHKAHLINTLCATKNKKAFVIASDELEAQKIANDLLSMGNKTFVYPAKDFNFIDIEGQSLEYIHKRIKILTSIIKKDFDVVVFCIDAGLQFTMPKEYLSDKIFNISVSQIIKIDFLIEKLLAFGYTNVDQVEGPGQFTSRGGIVDIFLLEYKYPIRLEFWGDKIDTISYFDPETQRRTDSIDKVNIIPAAEIIFENNEFIANKIEGFSNTLKGKKALKAKEILILEAEKIRNRIHIESKDKFISLVYKEMNTLFDYISKDDLIFVSEPSKMKNRINANFWQWGEDLKSYLERGILCTGLDTYSADFVYMIDKFEKNSIIYLDAFIHKNYIVPVRDVINFTAIQLPIWSGSLDLLCEDLENFKIKFYYCVVLAGTKRTAKSVTQDLLERGFTAEYYDDVKDLVPGKIIVMPGSLSAGFEYPSINTKLITHGYFHKTKSVKRRRFKTGQNIYSLSDLIPGDHIVHTSYGIGVFKGIRKIDMNGVVKDYIVIKYAKEDILYVPVTQLNLVLTNYCSFSAKIQTMEFLSSCND